MKKYTYKVVGVSFNSRDGVSRQKTIKNLFKEELETESFLRSHNVKLEGYEYEGADALAVFVDGKEIGNISADKVQEVAEIAQKASSCKVILSVNGRNVEDYEYIVDRYKNKKDWKENDSLFDEEEVNEEYKAMMEEIKENPIYSAVLQFVVPEEGDINIEKIEEKVEKAQKSKGGLTITLILGIILIVMSVVLMLAKPIIGIIGVLIGVYCCIYARKNIKANKENAEIDKEKSDGK